MAKVSGANGQHQGMHETGRALPGALIVPIERIQRDPQQPRRDWRTESGYERLDELTKSIKEFGILQPLLVQPQGDGYMVIAGGRRLVAAQRAGLTEIPVVVRSDDSQLRVRVLQLIENLQRQALSPLDEARAYQELMDLENLTPPQIALRVHISEQQVRDRLRVLRDQVLSDAVERKQIAMSVAREINKLPDTAASLLRQRVEAGDKLQLADIQQMRQTLAEAGIVNPRLSPRADRLPIPVETPLAPGRMVTPIPGPQPATDAEKIARRETSAEREGPSARPTLEQAVRRAYAEIDQKYTLYRASMAERPAVPPVAAQEPRPSVRAAEPSPGLARAGQRPEDAVLAHLLRSVDRGRLKEILLYALERGWTIAGLIQVLEQASTR